MGILFHGGSSPLARGLRRMPLIPGRSGRIIPARAGFTRQRRRRPDGAWDHPRSRGVYFKFTFQRRGARGSSPLARGLQEFLAGHDRARRIIPARAGFTLLRRPGTVPGRDHPRSRGVYPGYASGGVLPGGSSPLARGLRTADDINVLKDGIIPARAGFTEEGDVPGGPAGDHPRSRGVYSLIPSSEIQPQGSSPLARGLHRQWALKFEKNGIIPARAGFTPRRQPWPTRPRDHPRSRGVYRAARRAPPRADGSSPLARGLPPEATDTKVRAGIIPARAGFTWSSPASPALSRDHPRSRGVYTMNSFDSRSAAGSSPLARGLPVRRRRSL